MKNNWKILLKTILLYYLFVIIFTFTMNIFYYNDFINNTAIKYYQMISLLIIHFLLGIFMGKNSPHKGYLYGICLSCIIIALNILTSIIFHNLSFTNIIYYFIILLIITISSIIGINKKKSN